MDPVQRSSVVLLWDIDGTLIGHAPALLDRHLRATTQVLGKEAQKVASGLGKTDRQIVMEIMVSAGVDPRDDLVRAALDELDAITEEDLNQTPSQALPGVMDVLDSFRQRGVPQLLLTGNTPARARAKVSSAGLSDFFALDEGYYGENARDRFDVASQARNSMGHHDDLGRPRTLIVLGDTPLDVRAGQHVDMLTVAIATGVHQYLELVQEEPDLILSDLITDQHLLISYVANLMQ